MVEAKASHSEAWVREVGLGPALRRIMPGRPACEAAGRVDTL